MKRKWVWFLLLVVVALPAAGVWWLRSHGMGAQDEPAWLEAQVARQARRIAVPPGARELANPYPMTEADLPHAREHWVAHCSVCHGLDGRGETVFGRNMFPRVPDMTAGATQQMSDGEMFHVISNGIRFTGMPAFGGEDSPRDIWHLVEFIRRLPTLSPEELQQMERLAEGAEAGHTHPPGTPPHTH
jgi:mono/diheme cytochrome c family protein